MQKALVTTIFLFSALFFSHAYADTMADPADTLNDYCNNIIGEPRVEQVTDKIWIALSYDLASTVLIHTSGGSVIVDTGMSRQRAMKIREALEAIAPVAPVAAIIYTHSHIDHVGGAAVWAGPDTQIWSTDALPEHLLKQYGLFATIESIRGGRQFGRHVPDDKIPCSALGRRVDIEAALETGVLMPTNTFSGKHVFTIGDTTIELHEAHGETHDTLFVWLPDEDTIISGDNFYWSFPNLYTLRGTSPRPVDDWIASIDAIRSFNPQHLLPNHTMPVHGKKEIAATLTNYRDSIQWVRDETIRRANLGQDLDTIAENVALPPHLATLPYNGEFYGQVDWSAKAIYTNNIGWFDGRPETLYPLPRATAAAKEIEMMGGTEAVLATASSAADSGEFKWAVHLLTKLDDAGLVSADEKAGFNELFASALENVADTTSNANGAAYLREYAYEQRNGYESPGQPVLNEKLIAAVPLEHIFNLMALRLYPEKAMDIHSCVQFVFPDEKQRFFVTVRNGIAEVVKGKPLPGTPEPVATLTADAAIYRRMATGLEKPADMLAQGKLKVTGNMAKFMEFMQLFDTEM